MHKYTIYFEVSKKSPPVSVLFYLNQTLKEFSSPPSSSL